MNIILPLLCILLLFPAQVNSQSYTNDFLQSYDPESTYTVSSDYKITDAVRRMPLDDKLDQTNSIDYSRITELHTNSAKNIFSFGFFLQLNSYIKSSDIPFISFLRLIFFTDPSTKAITSTSKSIKHVNLTDIPLRKDGTGLNSRFVSNPFGSNIPAAAQEVYGWDPTGLWNPSINPTSYLQCTAYAKMMWNMNGIDTRDILKGNASEWIHSPDVTAYRIGTTDRLPNILDGLIWSDNEQNHVAVITYVKPISYNHIKAYEVGYTNGNAVTQNGYIRLRKDNKGNYSITYHSEGMQWLPDHIIHLKQLP